VTTENESMIINNFRDLDEAKKCFPNAVIEPCNSIIEYNSFSTYVKDIMNKIPAKYLNEHEFINVIRKINPAIASGIKIEYDKDTGGKEGSIILYLPNEIYLEYEYYIDSFGDFSIGDLKEEDNY